MNTTAINTRIRIGLWFVISIILMSLSACFGSGSTATKPTVDADSKKANTSDVETLLSQSIFLLPAQPSERSLYIKVTSTADKPVDLEGIQRELSTRFRSKGFRLSNVNDANFLLQVNILSISKTSKSLTKEAVSNGFGAAVSIANAAAGPAGQVVGAATESATSIFFRDTYFNMITDIMLSERTPRIHTADTNNTTNDASTQWKAHTTRALSSIKDVNANQEECIDNLEESLMRVLNGLL